MINIGIIGFGRIGAEHAGWINKTSNACVGGVFDPTAARLAIAEARGLKIADTIESLLEDASIDAVLIATPTAMHFDHAAMALRAGKHVMIEKPMTLDLDQARKLMSMNRGVMSVFHNRRWDADFLTVKRAVSENVFGKIINIESRISQWASCVGPAAREWNPNWRNESHFGGGGLYDWGSHLIDQMWQLMLPGKPLRVFAQLRGNVWSKDCDDFARVCIDFDNGAVGMVEINTTTTAPLPRWHIDGTNGSAEGPCSLKYNVNEWTKLRFQSADGKSSDLNPAEKGLNESDIWSQFAKAIRGEGEPAVPIESVLPTMQLIDAAFRSGREGIAVDLSAR